MTGTLLDRMLEAFPAGQYGLAALLRIVKVEETTSVESAAIECCLNPRLRINPEFVAKHAATPEKLLMLVMHELHHVLLGHTALPRNPSLIDNIVFDAVINATLCRMFPDPSCLALFTDLYSTERFPECLLRPPEGWSPDAEGQDPPALLEPERKAALAAYKSLYSPKGAYYDEIYKAFQRSLKPYASGKQDSTSTPVLLGSHGEATPADYDAAFQTIAPMVAHWHDKNAIVGGRGWGDVLNDERIQPRHRNPNRRILAKLIRRVARLGGDSVATGLTRAQVAGFSPIPSHSRRSAVLRALGVPQVLYEFQLSGRARERLERVHVYLDVSGSMTGIVEDLYGAVLDCAGMVHPKVHLFSTVTSDASLNELRKGVVRSTGGTDIHCVAKHIDENRISRAVILTDGYVGLVPENLRPRMETCILGIGISRFGSIDCLRPFANYIERLQV